MKGILIAGALALALSGCASLTAEEEAAIRDGIVEVAVELIAEAKEAGLDPVQIEEKHLKIIDLACKAADKFAPVVENYIAAKQADDPDFEPLDLRGYVGAVCAIAEAVVTVKEADA